MPCGSPRVPADASPSGYMCVYVGLSIAEGIAFNVVIKITWISISQSIIASCLSVDVESRSCVRPAQKAAS